MRLGLEVQEIALGNKFELELGGGKGVKNDIQVSSNKTWMNGTEIRNASVMDLKKVRIKSTVSRQLAWYVCKVSLKIKEISLKSYKRN